MTTTKPVWRYMPAAMVILCLMTFVPAYGGVPVRTVAHYTVSTMGFAIGDVTTTQRMSMERGEPGISFETRTAVEASFLWMGYHQETLEKGTLVCYARKRRGGDSWHRKTCGYQETGCFAIATCQENRCKTG